MSSLPEGAAPLQSGVRAPPGPDVGLRNVLFAVSGCVAILLGLARIFFLGAQPGALGAVCGVACAAYATLKVAVGPAHMWAALSAPCVFVKGIGTVLLAEAARITKRRGAQDPILHLTLRLGAGIARARTR
jgi:hypothetical protein